MNTTQKTMRLAELCWPDANAEAFDGSVIISYAGLESTTRPFDPYHDWNDAHRVVDVLVDKGLSLDWSDPMIGKHEPDGDEIILMSAATWMDAALAVLEANA